MFRVKQSSADQIVSLCQSGGEIELLVTSPDGDEFCIALLTTEGEFKVFEHEMGYLGISMVEE